MRIDHPAHIARTGAGEQQRRWKLGHHLGGINRGYQRIIGISNAQVLGNGRIFPVSEPQLLIASRWTVRVVKERAVQGRRPPFQNRGNVGRITIPESCSGSPEQSGSSRYWQVVVLE